MDWLVLLDKQNNPNNGNDSPPAPRKELPDLVYVAVKSSFDTYY